MLGLETSALKDEDGNRAKRSKHKKNTYMVDGHDV